MCEDVYPVEVFARYSEDVLSAQQVEASTIEYVLEVSSRSIWTRSVWLKKYLDAISLDKMEGRWVNDDPHADRIANCEFASGYQTHKVTGTGQ